MIGYLYILQTKNNHYYIGSTNDLNRRLLEHRIGKTASLRRLLPIKLVFSQKYEDIKTARYIELKLKRFKNRNILEKIIQEGIVKTGL